MSRPEDISAEVWNFATDTFDKMLCNDGYEGSRDDSIADLARAIMAATAAERVACADEARSYGGAIGEEIAFAILKRGEI